MVELDPIVKTDVVSTGEALHIVSETIIVKLSADKSSGSIFAGEKTVTSSRTVKLGRLGDVKHLSQQCQI